MNGRKVVFLIDNFFAHELGWEKVKEATEGLQNTIVMFSPANATSICQPLDQGTIRTWKAYYCRHWLRYVIKEFSEDRQLTKTMNVLRALWWVFSAWEKDVGKETIKRCWLKFRVSAPQYGPRREGENVEEVERLQVTLLNNVQSCKVQCPKWKSRYATWKFLGKSEKRWMSTNLSLHQKKL